MAGSLGKSWGFGSSGNLGPDESGDFVELAAVHARGSGSAGSGRTMVCGVYQDAGGGSVRIKFLLERGDAGLAAGECLSRRGTGSAKGLQSPLPDQFSRTDHSGFNRILAGRLARRRHGGSCAPGPDGRLRAWHSAPKEIAADVRTRRRQDEVWQIHGSRMGNHTRTGEIGGRLRRLDDAGGVIRESFS